MFYIKALRKELDSRGFQSTKLVYALEIHRVLCFRPSPIRLFCDL